MRRDAEYQKQGRPGRSGKVRGFSYDKHGTQRQGSRARRANCGSEGQAPAKGGRIRGLDEDDGRVITNDDFRETQINDDTISIPTRLNTSFLSPPPTTPNTPCKYSPSRSVRVPASIPNPDSPNEDLDNQLQLELEVNGEIGLANHTPEAAQSPLVRPRKESVDMETHIVGVGEVETRTLL